MKIFKYLMISSLSGEVKDNRKLYYKSSEMLGVSEDSFDSEIISHTYNDGIGEITCKFPIKIINSYAFTNCSLCTEMSLPDTIHTFKGLTFDGCTNLNKINIPKNLILSNLAFAGCKNIQIVNIDSLEHLFNIDFGAPSANPLCPSEQAKLYINDELITSIIVPDTINSLKPYVLANYDFLEDITLNDYIEEIGERAFQQCISLKYINLSKTLKHICTYAFTDCTSLTEINFPNSVNQLDSYCFGGCKNIIKYDFSKHILIPTIETDAFYNISNTCKIIVPDALYNDWIVAENWSVWASNIIKKSDWEASQTN